MPKPAAFKHCWQRFLLAIYDGKYVKVPLKATIRQSRILKTHTNADPVDGLVLREMGNGRYLDCRQAVISESQGQLCFCLAARSSDVGE